MRMHLDLPPGSIEDLALFASTWGLDLNALDNKDPWLRVAIERGGERPFKGNPEVISVIDLGRFGNRFYQLLNASMVARRLGCSEIRVNSGRDMGPLPRRIRGIQFLSADSARIERPALRGVFFTYRAFERLVEPLDPWFIQDTIDNLVAPFFELDQGSLGDHVIVLHFRGGDVFAGTPDWVPRPYVMPPACFYTAAVEYARDHLGVTEARVVYEDRGNPSVAAVEEYFVRHNIPFSSQSGTLQEDSATLLRASHLVISYGTFGEANALLSGRIRSLFSFRHVESHEWLYNRTKSLLQAALQQAKGARIFVAEDRDGGYIPPFGWERTAEQLHLMRNYPADALAMREILISKS
jgi:hypothetical protein